MAPDQVLKGRGHYYLLVTSLSLSPAPLFSIQDAALQFPRPGDPQENLSNVKIPVYKEAPRHSNSHDMIS